MRQYRIKEITGAIPIFIPQYSDDAGTTWNSIQGTTSLTKIGAEQLIDAFIKGNGGSVNEIFHSYGPIVKPLFD